MTKCFCCEIEDPSMHKVVLGDQFGEGFTREALLCDRCLAHSTQNNYLDVLVHIDKLCIYDPKKIVG